MKFLLAFLVASAFLAGCNYREEKQIDAAQENQGGGGGDSGTTHTPEPPKEFFTDLYAKVFKTKCVSCHNPNKPEDNVILTSYSDLMDSDPPILSKGKPKSSRLYKCLIAGAKKPMPKDAPQLSEIEVQAIYNWILKGAPETEQDALLIPEQNLN